MGEKTKNALIALLIVGLVSMTVAYAALSQQLTINSGAKVLNKSALWNVHFGTPVAGTPVGYASVATGKGLVKANDTTLSGLEVTLKAPGDSMSYTFDVTNSGTINAKIGTNGVSIPDISTITVSGASNDDLALIRNNLEFKLVYSAGDAKAGQTPAAGDTLASGQTRNLTLTISYKSSATSLPSDDITVSNLSAHIDYVQDVK